jgi:hypothetical protein
MDAKLQLLEMDRGINLVAQSSEFISDESNLAAKANQARDFFAFLVDAIYGEACFAHSSSMAQRLGPQLIGCANILSANAERYVLNGGERTDALIHLVCRTLQESSVLDRVSRAGVVQSLASQAHPGMIELHGVLAIALVEALAN